MSEEAYLLHQIRLIQEGYQKQIQPYVDRLAQIQAKDRIPAMYLSADQAAMIQEFIKEKEA